MFPTSVNRKWEIETAKCNNKKLQQLWKRKISEKSQRIILAIIKQTKNYTLSRVSQNHPRIPPIKEAYWKEVMRKCECEVKQFSRSKWWNGTENRERESKLNLTHTPTRGSTIKQ